MTRGTLAHLHCSLCSLTQRPPRGYRAAFCKDSSAADHKGAGNAISRDHATLCSPALEIKYCKLLDNVEIFVIERNFALQEILNMTVTPSFPSSPPPEGDQNRGSRLLVVQASLSMLAFALVSLRIYVRRIILKCFGVDDGLLIVGVVRGVLLESSTILY